MDKLINNFIEIRDFLSDSIGEKINFFLADCWDPISSHVLTKEVYKIVDNELCYNFQNFPKEYLPKVRLKILHNELLIEASIQCFLNQDTNLKFLANVDINSENFDLYYRRSFDPTITYVFFARFGHAPDLVIKGAKTAAAEYFMGKHTPLSLAYHIAHEEGII